MSNGRNIQGITIQIDGETKGLNSALQDVNKRTRDVTTELKDVERLLKFNPGNTEVIAQKQELLAKQVENTTERLNALKSAEADVQAQFARGEIGEEQYRGFRRELVRAESQLANFDDQLRAVGQASNINGMSDDLQDVSRRSQELVKDLKEIDAALKLDPGNAQLIEQKMRNLGDQSTIASQKLQDLKGAQADVEAQFARGDMGQAEYDRFNRDIIRTEAQLRGLDQEIRTLGDNNGLNQVSGDLRDIDRQADRAEGSVDKLGAALGGLAVGTGAGGVVSAALDMSSLDTSIDIGFNVPESSKASVKEAIKGVVAYGVDAEEALGGVRRQWALNKDASDEVNQAVVKGAGVITRAFEGVDFMELIQETNEIASELKITNQEALGLTNSLLKAGFPPEQIDIIAEYGGQLKRAGYNAEEVQAIMSAGVDTKSWNIDNLLDGIKEGRIKIAEFGQEVPKALTDLLTGTELSEKQFKKWGQAVAAGGEEGSLAMSAVAQAVDGIEDDTKRNAIGVQVFGTMWEEQGSKITQSLLGVNGELSTAKDNTDLLNQSTAAVDDEPIVKLRDAMNKMMTAMAPLLEDVAEIISKLADWMAANPELTATLLKIGFAVGGLSGALMAIGPVLSALSTIFVGAGVVIGAISAPVWGVVFAVGALIAIFIELSGGFGGAMDNIKAMGEATVENTAATTAFIQEKWGLLVEFVKVLMTDFSGTMQGVMDYIFNIFDGVLTGIDNLTGGKFQSITDTIRSYLDMAFGIASDTLTLLKDLFGVQVGIMKDLVTGNFSGMVEGVKNQLSLMSQYVSDIINRIMRFLGGIDLSSIGVDMLKGLIQGIFSMKSALINTVKDVVGGAVDGAKNLLDINSPSKVFETIGAFTGEGLEKGLLSMGGRVANASEKMTANSLVNPNQNVDIQGNGSAAGTSQTQAAVAPVVTINFTGPVAMNSEEDITELARRLQQYIDRANKGKGG